MLPLTPTLPPTLLIGLLPPTWLNLSSILGASSAKTTMEQTPSQALPTSPIHRLHSKVRQ